MNGRDLTNSNFQPKNTKRCSTIISTFIRGKIYRKMLSASTWGCGSGRWAKLVAPRVGKLHLIDPSEALEIARKNLRNSENCEFHKNNVESIPLNDNSQDFGYSPGVLHHIPDTENGLKPCVDKLKKNAPFLLYLYYRFDNRPGLVSCSLENERYCAKNRQQNAAFATLPFRVRF